MKYLYYILAIVIVISAAAAWGIFRDAEVRVSKPAVVINDRIITQDELDEMMASQPHDRTSEKYLESVILNELLIQEAVRREIYKEEHFRQSVENYYEQSLVKILLDRQYDRFDPRVTENEIEKYRSLAGKKVIISKLFYKDTAALKADRIAKKEKIDSIFNYLSDDLKFTVLTLDKGERSAPVATKNGVVVYRLDSTEPPETGMQTGDADIGEIREFIREQKKERLFEEWTEKLKANADIWRNT